MQNDHNDDRIEYPGMETDPDSGIDLNHSAVPPVVYPPIFTEHTAESPSQEPNRIPASHAGTQNVEWHKPAYIDPAYSEPLYTEPTYSEPHNEPQVMYSPGICVSQPYTQGRVIESKPARKPREPGRRLIGFLKAVCLVLVCSLFSGASAYYAMEYRFNRGDFTINNQVVLGGSGNEYRQDVTVPSPVLTFGDEMQAQDIYDMACAQVVGIKTEAPGFGGGWGGQSTVPVSGSGFIISSDGYILTNYHVIEMAHMNILPLSVVLHDGTTYSARVIGFEVSNDVAVIKIDATGLTPAIIGNSENIRVGQSIYAVGNPFGDLVYTMTEGIVSALDRVVSVERKSINTFQFSAAVNSGNSGGPIYDTAGEVIGIVTAKLIRGNVEGIGFAIPINDAIVIASELIEHGYISGRPFIGITNPQTVSSGHAEYFGFVEGVYVRGIIPDSAAEKAGLEIADIITALGDDDVDSVEMLRFIMRKYKAGDTVSITVWRSGESVELTITFDEDLSAGQPHPGTVLPEDNEVPRPRSAP